MVELVARFVLAFKRGIEGELATMRASSEAFPWHYDHHMGPNQNANWCVTRPWMDIVMGTREPYAGTDRERATLARRAVAAP